MKESRSETVCDADLQTCNRIIVFSRRILPVAEIPCAMFIMVIRESHDTVQGCSAGKIVGIAQRVFVGMAIVGAVVDVGDVYKRQTTIRNTRL